MVFISEQCVLCKRLGELFNKRHRVWFCLFPPATNKPVFVYSRQAAGRELLIHSQAGFPSLFSLCCWWRPGSLRVLCTWHQSTTDNYRWMNFLLFSRCVVFRAKQHISNSGGYSGLKNNKKKTEKKKTNLNVLMMYFRAETLKVKW